jgi:hypothetical protein
LDEIPLSSASSSSARGRTLKEALEGPERQIILEAWSSTTGTAT